MKKLIIFFLSFISIQTFAQDEHLIGKWTFKEITDIQKLDSFGKKWIVELFKDMSIVLNANHHYKAEVMGKTDIGSWKFFKDSSELEITSNKGEITRIKITIDSLNNMTYSTGKNTGFSGLPVLSRSDLSEMDNFRIELVTVENANAKMNDVSKKWYLSSTEKPNRDPKTNEIITQLVKGIYLDLRDKTNYVYMFSDIESKGTWIFDEKNQTITYGESEDSKVFWKIKSITANSMDLIKGNSQEIWHYSTEP